MNPEDNQPQEPTTGANPAPENISTSDQADVAAAINQLAADAVAAGGPAEAATAPEPTSAPDTASAPGAASIPITISGPEPSGSPAPDIAAAVTELDADAVLDSIDAPETTPENSIPNAIGVDAVASASEAEQNATAEGETSEENGEAAKIVSEEGEEEPIKPADPVPGSIGSAVNYSETAPNHAAPTEKKSGSGFSLFSKKPKATASSVVSETPVASETPAAGAIPGLTPEQNKKNSTILALIIIGVVVLIGIIVMIIVFIITSSTNEPTTTTTDVSVEEAEPEESSLICSYTSTAEDIAKTNDKTLASYEGKMIANYSDDELVDMSLSFTYNYTSADAASEGARRARITYAREYNNLGMTEDPFASNYPVSGTTATATHVAEADEIDEFNAPLLYLSANASGKVITTKEKIRSIYVERGYTCSGNSDEEETEDTDSATVENDGDTTEVEEDVDTYEPDDTDYTEDDYTYDEEDY